MCQEDYDINYLDLIFGMHGEIYGFKIHYALYLKGDNSYFSFSNKDFLKKVQEDLKFRNEIKDKLHFLLKNSYTISLLMNDIKSLSKAPEKLINKKNISFRKHKRGIIVTINYFGEDNIKLLEKEIDRLGEI